MGLLVADLRYIGKSVTCALCLTLWNLAVPTFRQEQGNKERSWVCNTIFFISRKPLLALCVYRIVYIHTCVGFGVARSTERAMPEPQSVGRVTGRTPTLLFCISVK